METTTTTNDAHANALGAVPGARTAAVEGEGRFVMWCAFLPNWWVAVKLVMFMEEAGSGLVAGGGWQAHAATVTCAIAARRSPSW